jgi:hypothetical protein
MRVTLILVAVCLLFTGHSWLQFEMTSNCGGNSAALSVVQNLAITAKASTYDGPNHTFCFPDATPIQRQALVECAGHLPKRGPHYLVATGLIMEDDPQPRRVIAVCDKAYTNVPKSFFGSPHTHAAGYADGSSGLISPTEFNALDRTKFVAIDTLLLPKEAR